VLGIAGLSVLTPYLDYVLLPALVVLLAVTTISYQKWKKVGSAR
jgi:mercuric ion transport protein